jgi:hypothetical protein
VTTQALERCTSKNVVGASKGFRPALTADARQCFVDGDPRQPGREAGRAIELTQVCVGIHVGLLHHVFGFVLVPHDRPGRPVDALVVAAHQQFEQRGVAREHLLNDEGILWLPVSLDRHGRAPFNGHVRSSQHRVARAGKVTSRRLSRLRP